MKAEAEAARRVGSLAAASGGGLDQLNALNTEARQALQWLEERTRVCKKASNHNSGIL